MHRALALLLAVAACGGARTRTAPPPAAPEPAAASPDVPWDAPPVSLGEVPQVYLTEWQRAANRGRCPLLVMTDLGAGAGADGRRADFGEGWGVTYDKAGLPGTGDNGLRCIDCGRSAFGLAGTAASRGSVGTWTKEEKWPDGSRARHGIGGAGRHVAYLEIMDVDCVYHVWSSLGEDHLMTLLRGLRRVGGK
jgi:hypothetical protein